MHGGISENMVSVYQLKEKFQAHLRPLVQQCAAKGITANQVTLAACALSIMYGGLMAVFYNNHWPWLLLPLVMFVRMAMNAVDGMLAREHNMKSSLGAILNELGDVVSDTALYMPFAFLVPDTAWLIVLVLVLAVISEMAGVVAIQIGASRRYDGPMGKSDRAFVFGSTGFLIGIGVLGPAGMLFVFAVVGLLLCLTIWNRCRKALQEVATHGA